MAKRVIDSRDLLQFIDNIGLQEHLGLRNRIADIKIKNDKAYIESE